VYRIARLAAGLVRARTALDDRVDELEVARVRRERHGHALARLRPVGAGRAVVVLDVAGAALRHRGVDVHRLLALELGDDRFVRAPDGVCEHVQPPAMGHAQHDLARAFLGALLDQLVDHRHERVEAFDRELLLAEERLVQVALERLDLRQALEQRALLVGVKRGPVRAPLDRLAQPDATVVPGDVLDLVGDRAAVGLLKVGERVRERLARNGDAQDRRGDLPHQLGRQVHGLRVERRVAARRRAQRVEPRREVAVHAVRLDDRGRCLDRLEQDLPGSARDVRLDLGGNRVLRGDLRGDVGGLRRPGWRQV
jgi:hypothetical protein